MKEFFKKYKHGLLALYIFIYLPWFALLEQKVTTDFYVIHTPLDDLIPFCELFIIPYFLWFGYVAFGFIYFFLKSKEDFIKMCIFLFSGMTLFLIICTVFPNGLELRPETFARDNIFVDMVKALYMTDTSTNVCPSIHVFNSIGVHIAINRASWLKDKKWARYTSLILCVLICLSTMFLKQHSVVDVFCACILAYVLYKLVYSPGFLKIKAFFLKEVVKDKVIE